MTTKYEIYLTQIKPRRYVLVNPSGVEIAFGMTYRVASDFRDRLNAERAK